jgi:hypothetical protein
VGVGVSQGVSAGRGRGRGRGMGRGRGRGRGGLARDTPAEGADDTEVAAPGETSAGVLRARHYRV